MKIRKLLIGAATGILTAGVVPSILLTSSSCSKEHKQEELISVVSTEQTILNKATYRFAFKSEIPETIKLVWIKDKKISQKVKISNNHDIPVDQTTGEFNLNFEVLPKPNKWNTFKFELSFHYEIEDQTFVYTVPSVQLNNGTIETTKIHIENGSTKLITSYEDNIGFHFAFNDDSTTAIPDAIDDIVILDLPNKYKDIVQLSQSQNIPVDNATHGFDIGISLEEEINEVISFSFLISYYIDNQNYCYYSNDVSIILYKTEDEPKTYLTLRAFGDSGTISYSCSTSSASTPAEKNIFYRINGTSYWSYLPMNEKILLHPYERIDFCGINDTWSTYEDRYYFEISTPVAVSGTPEALIHGGVVSNTLSGDYCFSKLFWNCSNIKKINADFLPMHALTPHCYDGIFDGCTNLTCQETFNLPAKVLQAACYRRMFAGTKIKDIKYYANIAPDGDYTYQWLLGCPEMGSIQIPSDVDLSTIERSETTIPATWDDTKQFKEPLTIISKENGTIILRGYDANDKFDPSYVTDPSKQIFYTYNYPNEQLTPWTRYGAQVISLPKNEYIYVQGNNPNGWYNQAQGETHHLGFKADCAIELQGNIMSLIDSTLQTTMIPYTNDQVAGFPNLFTGNKVLYIGPRVLDVEGILPVGCFRHAFADCAQITQLGSIIRLIKQLPLKAECCKGMFSNCTSLETIGTDDMAPQALVTSCFEQMFSGCINLKTAPLVTNEALSAAAHCFDGMFSSCLQLTSSAPIKTFEGSDYCYANMFSSCINLLQCPEIRTVTRVDGNHYFDSMFKNCSSIRDIPEMPTFMMSGNFTCESMFELCSQLQPGKDTGKYITLPLLGFGESCYKNMFARCYKLQYVHVDMSGQGKDFENSPMLPSAFEGWLPSPPTLAGCTILIRNYKEDFDFQNVPAAFAPNGWVVPPPTNSSQQPLNNSCCIYKKEY